MGRRGPPPKPTALKLLAGSHRAKLNKSEPKPEIGEPERPCYLSMRAIEYWDNLIAYLVPLGLVTKVDGDSLAMYCQALARLTDCEEIINREGMTYTQYAPDGEIKMIRNRPEVNTAKELYTIVTRLGREFGLSPSSRAHLGIQRQEPKRGEDKKASFFGVG